MFSSLGPLKNIVKTDVFSLCKGTRLYFGPGFHFASFLAPLEPLFGAFGSPWGTLGASWAPLELPKALLGGPLRPKSHHICIFGMCFGVILMSKGGWGRSWAAFCTILEHFRVPLGLKMHFKCLYDGFALHVVSPLHVVSQLSKIERASRSVAKTGF